MIFKRKNKQKDGANINQTKSDKTQTKSDIFQTLMNLFSVFTSQQFILFWISFILFSITRWRTVMIDTSSNVFIQTDPKLTSKIIAELETLGTSVFVPAGQKFASYDTIPSTSFIVKSGIVMGKDPAPVGDNEKLFYEISGSGVLLFYANYTMGLGLRADYVAVTDTTLIAIKSETLSDLAIRKRDVFKALVSAMSSNALCAGKQADIPNYASIAWRYSNFLVMLAEENGEETEDGIRIVVPFTQTESAKYLGVNRTMTHFICADLQKYGIITQKKMEIIIHSLDGLKEYSQKYLSEFKPVYERRKKNKQAN